MIYTKQARYPTPLFPVGSRPLVRFYQGRSRADLLNGRLLTETHAHITAERLLLPEPIQIESEINPATGILAPITATLWLVDADGDEHYLCNFGTHTEDGVTGRAFYWATGDGLPS